MYKYQIFDENNELMRLIQTKTEAKLICLIRHGWTFKFIKPVKHIFEDAPF